MKSFVRLPKTNDAIRILIGKRAQQNRIDQAGDGSIGPDGDRQCEHSYQGYGAIFAQTSETDCKIFLNPRDECLADAHGTFPNRLLLKRGWREKVNRIHAVGDA